MEIKIECPFCGGDLISVIEDGRLFCCLCADCSCQGPTASSKAGAVEAWNDRA